MNEIKEKILAMMKQETTKERREEFNKLRKKKPTEKNKKEIKQHSPMAVEKNKFIKHLGLIVLLLLTALGLFYTASTSKQNAQYEHQQQLKISARQNLDILFNQATQTLGLKTNTFHHILSDAEYIKNFNTPSWQDVLKTDLEARLGEQAIVDIIPAAFNSDEILDNPEMGYGVLSLLNELKKTTDNKSDSSIKIEVHKANNKDARLLFLQKVSQQDVKLKKQIGIGYIMARLPQEFMQQLIKNFKAKEGYIEIVQTFSGKASVLAKKGDTSLKSKSMLASKKMNNTPWTLNLWSAEQTAAVPVTLYWQAMAYLGLGSLMLVSALLLLGLMIKNTLSKRRILAASAKGKNKTTQHTVPQDEAFPDGKRLIHIADNIFRAYDIRGVVGEYVNAAVFRQIAYAVAKEMTEQQQTNIAIACDGRNSSPELVKALIDALLKSGINVLDIGMVTSPILYFAALTKAEGNGIIVTASHNPGNYNGMKIMLQGHSYNNVRLQKIKAGMLNGERVAGNGKLSKLNVIEDYMTKITGNIILARPMNIVIDTANGITGKFASTFFEQLGCKVTALNSKVDGNFPVHDPDPSRPENLSELIAKVTETKADLGIAFDGDGDRIGLISSGGEIIWPDRILMLLAKDILARNKGATILYDVKSSWKLDSFISELGGKAIMCKSGHSFMKSKLLETGALLAGEMSGHIFIKERWFGFDDALFVAARVLEILSIDLRKSRQVFAELPDSLNTPEILIATTQGPEIMKKMNADSSCFSDGKIITIDGIRVEYPDGWGLVRSSNTSDNLTLRFEADNESAMQRIADIFKKALLTVEPQLMFPF